MTSHFNGLTEKEQEAQSMSDMTELDEAFDKWLAERKDDSTLRQQFWTAFKAGADHVLKKMVEGRSRIAIIGTPKVSAIVTEER